MLKHKPQIYHLAGGNTAVLNGVDLSHSMFLVVRGQVRYRAEGAEHLATAPALVHAPSQSAPAIVDVSPDGELWVAVWTYPLQACALSAYKPIDYIFYARRRAREHIPLKAKAMESLMIHINNIERAATTPEHIFHDQMMLSTFATLYLSAVYLFGEHDRGTAPDDSAYALVARLTDMLTHEAVPDRSVEQYAEALGVSRQYLHRATRRVLNMSLTELLDCRRLEHILRQLVYSNKDLDEIAEETAFSSTGALTRFCTRLTGATPAQWRALRSYSLTSASHYPPPN
ncbi:MAG: helix-turn-helix transcriptional regulator [Muribaculaceae bacterium]